LVNRRNDFGIGLVFKQEHCFDINYLTFYAPRLLGFHE